MKDEQQENFPKVPEILLKELEVLFPPKDFGPQVEYATMLFHNGQRSVVNFLKAKLKEQNNNLLNKGQ